MRLLIIGAGGHGIVVADAAAASQQWSEISFIDDAYPDLGQAGPWNVLGVVSALKELRHQVDSALVAIGDNVARMHLLTAIENEAIPLATVIHPLAVVSDLCEIGDGTALLANAVVNACAKIGKGCIINTGAIVEHDCGIADGVHVAPGATLAADVTVGENSWIGAGATVREQVSIGSGVVVGLGAAVVHDVGNSTTVAGVPAKPIEPRNGQQPTADGETTS